MKKEWPVPKIGEIWVDRDKRSWSGNRRVVVTLIAFGAVTYRQVIGVNDSVEGRAFRSKLERFTRAFRPLGQPESAGAVARADGRVTG